jgi:hypothetical protein
LNELIVTQEQTSSLFKTSGIVNIFGNNFWLYIIIFLFVKHLSQLINFYQIYFIALWPISLFDGRIFVDALIGAAVGSERKPAHPPIRKFNFVCAYIIET